MLAHEVLHCALAHQCRRGKRELGLWNAACDYAVNPILLDNGMTLPADALVDPAFRDLSSEEIYARLQGRARDQESQNDAQQSSGAGGPNPRPIQAINTARAPALAGEQRRLQYRGERP